jgi:hypothetical protein
MGVGWRIAILIILSIVGCAFILCGVTAPTAEYRSTLLQMGAAPLTVIPIYVAYVAWRNRSGW